MILRSPTNNPLGKRPLNYMGERYGMGDYPAPDFHPPMPPVGNDPTIAAVWNKVDGFWYFIPFSMRATESAAQLLADSTIARQIYDHDWATQIVAGRTDQPADPSNFIGFPKGPMAVSALTLYPQTAAAEPTSLAAPSGSLTSTAASWFSGSTQIAGQSIPNVALLAAAGVLAFLFMGGGKKGKR